MLFEKPTMNISLLSRHQNLVSLIAACLSLSVSLSFGLGQLKDWQEISWLDILGEGSIALLSLFWLFFILISRPPGRVTTGLVLGLSCFMFSALLDLFDEFVHYQAAAAGLSLIESIPAGIGMLIMSYALWHWHQEQLALNRQLCRREANTREHGQIDFITQLYRADYMRGQIDMQLRTKDDSPFSIMMLDIDNFDRFNRQFGPQEGDRLLREISELILMNLRTTDLACRYAGDRFILLLPGTDLTLANELAQDIRQAISHLAFKPYEQASPIFHSMTIATEVARAGDAVDSIISRVNRRLDDSKQHA
ncbi:MAG: GGDEF domain-containing protein [Alteromonadaceae bacterium]|uniref:diguanylate cyclase n=3 Tax=Paraglaciecola chathamensis TaxID=368405 RepID=A0ABS0WHL6_9ALTE|nr:diguanylate cyclase [Paraglaciecola chathamensis]MBN23484.1 GGDEF domain-containing protein [Alteromonadaceae bacterium]MBU3018032.1 diguanylate cyclase [Paraglaciecola agarilytica]GAC07654.1 GGDEF domain protein [Paraglaciecola agarilytica NO2]